MVSAGAATTTTSPGDATSDLTSLTSSWNIADKEVSSFQDDGYLVIRNFVPPSVVDVINDAVDRAWSDKSIYNPLTISAYTNTSDYTETYIRGVDNSARTTGYKLNHLYLYDHRVLEILMSSRVQSVVRRLLGGRPLLFNGLNMEFGSEQRYHFDTLYMPPRSEGKMVVLWFALERAREEAGALQYYPRSHKIPPFVFSHGQVWAIDSEMPAFDRYMEAHLAERRLLSERFTAEAGDLFIWHAQLYHGGSQIQAPGLTRRSMVAHFWDADDVDPSWRWEARPGRYVLDPRWMCEPANFRP